MASQPEGLYGPARQSVSPLRGVNLRLVGKMRRCARSHPKLSAVGFAATRAPPRRWCRTGQYNVKYTFIEAIGVQVLSCAVNII